jgi:hypothetical protein
MPPEVSSQTKASTVDEVRLKNYRTSLQQRNDMEVRELQSKHDDEVQRVIENQTAQINELRQAYDVQISREAEALEESLHRIRMGNEDRIESEKQAAETEVNKIKTANEQRLSEYKKNSEAQMDALRKQLQASADQLHERARKAAKKERQFNEKA